MEKTNKSKRVTLWVIFFLIVYIIIFVKLATNRIFDSWAFFEIDGLVVTGYILSRFILAYFHTSPPIDKNYEPTVTFVVPAKNEEDNIAETIRRFSEVEYPLEKVEVIAVNDGSTDRTYDEMLKIQEELKNKIPIRLVNWEKNRGKRAGMAEGVKLANNDIVIFIDSDSFIASACVRHLVKYFVNPEIGAVSGHTDVFNRDTNLLTKMQAVRYFVAFNVYKAAESIFGNVTCCPGCCSAYRRSYLMVFIDAWLHQKFLGTDCTFGDDRSLTNFMLQKYKAVYSSDAIAYTVAPDTMKKYIKQQQRWKKSWFRETFIAAGFMWRKHPVAAFFFYLYIILAISSPIVLIHALFWYPIATRTLPLIYVLGVFLMLSLQGIYYQIKTGYGTWAGGVLFMWFSTVFLIWQLPWALITIRDTRWGTR
jgi:hyaluronan synthase